MERQLFDALMVIMPVLAIIVFVALFFVKAGYGWFRTRNWGLSIDNRIGWVCMEAPVFFVMAHLWWYSEVRFEAVPFLCFLLFEVHYFQRSFIFPCLMRGNIRRHGCLGRSFGWERLSSWWEWESIGIQTT